MVDSPAHPSSPPAVPLAVESCECWETERPEQASFHVGT